MKKKTFIICLAAEATVWSPEYKIKAETSEEAFAIAEKKFNKVIDRIENTKWFHANPSEIYLYTMDDENGVSYDGNLKPDIPKK